MTNLKDQIAQWRALEEDWDGNDRRGDKRAIREACDALEASHVESEDRMARCVRLQYRLTKAEERIAVLEEALRWYGDCESDEYYDAGRRARKALKGDA